MSSSIQDQVAIITGGASGIGFAVAQKLKSDGARVALFDLNPEGLAKAKEALGGDVLTVETDVSSEESVNSAVKTVEERFGQIDMLLNAAGIVGQTNVKIVDTDFESFELVQKVNVNGSFLLSKAVIPVMEKRGYGRILLIASIAGKDGNAGMSSYSTSKAAVIGLAKAVGKEYAGTGITINALAPAVIHTPILDTMPQAQIDYMTSRIPMGRVGTLQEIADLSRFILSPENSFTTGFCYDLSGGRAVY